LLIRDIVAQQFSDNLYNYSLTFTNSPNTALTVAL
jgi:hypothetical protein